MSPNLYDEGISSFTPQQSATPVFRMGNDPGVACRLYAAQTLWFLGYPEQAMTHLHEALTLAHALAHPLGLAQAQCAEDIVAQLCRDVPSVDARAEAGVD